MRYVCLFVGGEEGMKANKWGKQELRDVVQEANAYKEGWGQLIFQTANEMFNHDRLQARAAQVQREAEKERKWYDGQRERASKELLEEGSDSSDGVLVEKNTKGKK
jgi:translocation protein SEC66